MAEGAFVAYYRVSTERQGKSGLGLEAQRKAVEDFLNGSNWRLVAEFTEISRPHAAALESIACSPISSACTQPWATAPQPRLRSAWRRSPGAWRHDLLITSPLYSQGEAQPPHRAGTSAGSAQRSSRSVPTLCANLPLAG